MDFVFSSIWVWVWIWVWILRFGFGYGTGRILTRSYPLPSLGGWTGVACDLQVNQYKIICAIILLSVASIIKREEKFYLKQRGKVFIFKNPIQTPPPFLCFFHFSHYKLIDVFLS